MARSIIRPEWREAMHKAVDTYHTEGIIPDPQVFTWNESCKWYIRLLTETHVPFLVVQKGAGVKEVVIQQIKCPTCKGRGYVEEEYHGRLGSN